jgi:hypothetical protein
MAGDRAPEIERGLLSHVQEVSPPRREEKEVYQEAAVRVEAPQLMTRVAEGVIVDLKRIERGEGTEVTVFRNLRVLEWLND